MLFKKNLNSTKKHALITGVSSGFGRTLSFLLAKKGWSVTGISRNSNKLSLLEKKISFPERHRFLTCDINDYKGLEKAVKNAISYAPVDVVVNNAGIGLFKNLTETTTTERRHIIETNLLAAMDLTALILPHMIKNQEGHIINISSVAGKRTWKRITAYSASKFGLIGFSNSLRRELKYEKHPIAVTTVCPPASKTGFFNNSGYPNYEADHEGDYLFTSQEVAIKIYEAILKRPREVIVGRRAKILDTMNSISPVFTEWLEDTLKR